MLILSFLLDGGLLRKIARAGANKEGPEEGLRKVIEVRT